jgi:hypothetical protein
MRGMLEKSKDQVVAEDTPLTPPVLRASNPLPDGERNSVSGQCQFC